MNEYGNVKALRAKYTAKSWVNYSKVPLERGVRNGDRVCCTQFGDDYHRQGVITGKVNDLYCVDYGDGREEFYTVNDLEFWQ